MACRFLRDIPCSHAGDCCEAKTFAGRPAPTGPVRRSGLCGRFHVAIQASDCEAQAFAGRPAPQGFQCSEAGCVGDRCCLQATQGIRRQGQFPQTLQRSWISCGSGPAREARFHKTLPRSWISCGSGPARDDRCSGLPPVAAPFNPPLFRRHGYAGPDGGRRTREKSLPGH